MTPASYIGSDPAKGTVAARGRKLVFLVTEDWYFVSHRLELAIAARQAGYDVVVATRVDRHGRRITDAGLTLCPVAFNRGWINPLEEFRTLIRLASQPEIDAWVDEGAVEYCGRETVQQAATGWLVPAQDAQALATALQQAIEQPELREQYGASARALIAADFSTSRVAGETIAVYDELID